MVEKNNVQRTLMHFFTYPTKSIHLRELARTLNVSTTTVLNAIETLQKERLLIIDRQTPLTMVKANLENPLFTRLKRVHNLETLYLCNIVDVLDREMRPQAIIVFGSYARGEDTEQSDIDIAIIDGKKTNLPLDTFDRKLHRNISIHHFPKNPQGSLAENLRNGIVLVGAI